MGEMQLPACNLRGPFSRTSIRLGSMPILSHLNLATECCGPLPDGRSSWFWAARGGSLLALKSSPLQLARRSAKMGSVWLNLGAAPEVVENARSQAREAAGGWSRFVAARLTLRAADGGTRAQV